MRYNYYQKLPVSTKIVIFRLKSSFFDRKSSFWSITDFPIQNRLFWQQTTFLTEIDVFDRKVSFSSKNWFESSKIKFLDQNFKFSGPIISS